MPNLEQLIQPLLVLLIFVIGFGTVLFRRSPLAILRYLLAPFIWLFGGIIRLVVFIAIAAISIYMFTGINIGDYLPTTSIIPPIDDTPDPPQPPVDDTPDPPQPPVESTSKVVFGYPVGNLSSLGLRNGDNWNVTQDFADTIEPVNAANSGLHLGEDWQPKEMPFDCQPVYAVADGTILANAVSDSLGFYLFIKHELTNDQYEYVTSLYAHMNPLPGLWPEQAVKRGQLIGHTAETGSNGCPKGCTFTGSGCEPKDESVDAAACYGWPVHLHFELRAPSAEEVAGFGYSSAQLGFLNPTDRGSAIGNSGGGWIDATQSDLSAAIENDVQPELDESHPCSSSAGNE